MQRSGGFGGGTGHAHPGGAELLELLEQLLPPAPGSARDTPLVVQVTSRNSNATSLKSPIGGDFSFPIL